ncbi:transglutaminase-like putative cysteine protease [Paenibacillus endophyticus]|uniref:Transglutaminase-like putative cysteine protease n=1 Tax=Paenibacillus endophyticus TaxID=1294268 RepID=A0A7W5G8R8_9BACL|nr:transglutaminase-like putative cysteine protease [Paenibacillus endophyticus]
MKKEVKAIKLLCESDNLDDYLTETAEVNYNHPLIVALFSSLVRSSNDPIGFVKNSYEYVRDEINHSWDIQSSRVTCTASETLLYQEGICYAKANLLSALLRKAGIPAGFCYQRLTLGDTPESGYCIHALNGVYIAKYDQWIRLDARGNKKGVHAEFSIDTEKLAFPIRPEYGEVDYPYIFRRPNHKTIEALRQNTDCKTMYLHSLPSQL